MPTFRGGIPGDFCVNFVSKFTLIVRSSDVRNVRQYFCYICDCLLTGQNCVGIELYCIFFSSSKMEGYVNFLYLFIGTVSLHLFSSHCFHFFSPDLSSAKLVPCQTFPLPVDSFTFTCHIVNFPPPLSINHRMSLKDQSRMTSNCQRMSNRFPYVASSIKISMSPNDPSASSLLYMSHSSFETSTDKALFPFIKVPDMQTFDPSGGLLNLPGVARSPFTSGRATPVDLLTPKYVATTSLVFETAVVCGSACLNS